MKTEYSFDNETWYDAPDDKAFVPGVGEIYLRMNTKYTASQPKVASIADDAQWSTDEICKACVTAGLGILECNSLMVTLKGTSCAPADQAASVEDLAMLVRRLVSKLEKECPGTDLAPQALDYLKRVGLQGSPLRAAPQQSLAPAAEVDMLHFNAQRLRNVAALVGVTVDGDHAHVDGVRGALLGQIAFALRKAAAEGQVSAAAPADINDDGHFANLLGEMHPLSKQSVIDFVNDWVNSRASEGQAQTSAVLEASKQAGDLVPILRGMCEGGGVERDVDIYATAYQADDGDVFVRRAADLLEDIAAQSANRPAGADQVATKGAKP